MEKEGYHRAQHGSIKLTEVVEEDHTLVAMINAESEDFMDGTQAAITCAIWLPRKRKEHK
jgi:hypothetical protein